MCQYCAIKTPFPSCKAGQKYPQWMDLLLLTRIPISKWGDFWLDASGNHKAVRTKNSLNYSVKRNSLRKRTLQRMREREGSVASKQPTLAHITMMVRIKLRCHFSRFTPSSLLSKFRNTKLKSLSCCIWGPFFFFLICMNTSAWESEKLIATVWCQAQRRLPLCSSAVSPHLQNLH